MIDFFADPSGQFLVMEFIPGDDLSTMLAARSSPFPLEDVLRWAGQLLDVLEHLHGQQPPIIHRDIKPQNIKLTPRGEVVLLDFGLAEDLAPRTARRRRAAWWAIRRSMRRWSRCRARAPSRVATCTRLGRRCTTC